MTPEQRRKVAAEIIEELGADCADWEFDLLPLVVGILERAEPSPSDGGIHPSMHVPGCALRARGEACDCAIGRTAATRR